MTLFHLRTLLCRNSTSPNPVLVFLSYSEACDPEVVRDVVYNAINEDGVCNEGKEEIDIDCGADVGIRMKNGGLSVGKRKLAMVRCDRVEER